MAAERLRPEIPEVLGRLRARIRRYVFLEGVAIVVALLGLLFWASLGLDWMYFRLQRAELPQSVRFAITVAAVCTVLFAAVSWIVLRVFRSFHARALALVLERRFPELNDRLITAVELADQSRQEPHLTTAMLERTSAEVADITRHLRLSEVFDLRPLLRATLSAAFVLISVVAFAVYFGDTFEIWYRRNVLLANDQWQRETALKLVVLAEPGERVVEFRNGVYKHPRGSDLTLLAQVLPGKKVPDRVEFRYWGTEDSSRGRAYFSQLGQSDFKHTMAGVLSSLEFVIYAGDAERNTYRIEVVDPPRLDAVTLQSLYPAYTGMNLQDPESGELVRTDRPVQGTQISLPAGTDFWLACQANKPLVGVRIQTDAYDVEIGRTGARLILFQRDGDRLQGGTFDLPKSSTWLAADGTSFSVPFVLAGPEQQEVVSESRQVHLPLRLPPDAVFRIFLADSDDIRSTEPSRLTVNSIIDESPRIETRLRGIGTSVTRRARIPVTGLITDDYGIASAEFQYRIDAEEEFQSRPLSNAPAGVKEFPLESSAETPYERFELLPLELEIGRKLTLAIAAEDGDDLNGPHAAQGERYTFQIVSDEELLSNLYAKELNLRHRFEQILSEMTATRDDLLQQRPRLEEVQRLLENPPTGDKAEEARQALEATGIAVLASADRALNGVRKNHNETQAIEQSFGDIREELVNNAVDTPQSLERLDVKLIKPLHEINTVDYNDVDQTLGLYRLALEEKGASLARLDESLGHINRLIEHMQAVLYEMRRLETFKELVELLKAIKAQQDELRQQTEAERKRKLLEDLE